MLNSFMNYCDQLDMSGKVGFEEYRSLRSDLVLCRVSIHTVIQKN